jgi:signal transduction histidine kinase/CheY-like chemotaxis protein
VDLKRIELALLSLTLLVLVLEAFFVFRPAVKRTEIAMGELQTARNDAVAALEVRKEFVSRVSHELRNPLNTVVGMTDLLANRVADRDQKRFVQILERASGTLMNLINDVLDFSKSEAGHMQLVKMDFELYDVVHRAIDLATPLAEEKGLELVVDIDPGLPTKLSGDAKRLQQILGNLLGNAVKFTEAGEIRLSVERAGETGLAIAVTDTGIGIARDKVSHVFESFYQAHDSKDRRQRGTGLGLTVCKQLVELMGGEIFVESEEGKGSTFRFHIPLKPARAATEASAKPALTGRRVALAVRNASAKAALARVLAAWGATVIEPGECDSRDIVVLDRDATDFEARKNAVRPEQLILLISTRQATEGIDEARKLGVRHYLFKPAAGPELAAAIAGIMGAMPERSTAKSAGPLRVLIADDSPENLELLKVYLTESGHSVTAAGDGEAASRLFATERFDVAILDIQMPGLDGREAIRRIRALERVGGRAPIRAIAVTAYGHTDERDRCLAAGFDELLTKPLKKDVLLNAIAT